MRQPLPELFFPAARGAVRGLGEGVEEGGQGPGRAPPATDPGAPRMSGSTEVRAVRFRDRPRGIGSSLAGRSRPIEPRRRGRGACAPAPDASPGRGPAGSERLPGAPGSPEGRRTPSGPCRRRLRREFREPSTEASEDAPRSRATASSAPPSEAGEAENFGEVESIFIYETICCNHHLRYFHFVRPGA